MKYTGINKLFHNDALQEFLDGNPKLRLGGFVSDWRWILAYTKRRRGAVALYTVLGIIASTLNVALAYVTGMLINLISLKGSDRLVLYTALTLGVIVLLVAADALKSRVGKKTELDLVRDIQSDMFSGIMELRWEELRSYSKGDLLNRFNKDLETVMNNAISWIPGIVINVYTFTIILVLFFRMDPVMGWIALASTPFIFFISRFILRRQKEYKLRLLETDSEMMSFESESLYNIDTIKALGVLDFLTKRFAGLQDKYRSLHLEYNSFQIRTEISVYLLGTAAALGTLGYCLYRLWTGDILFGDMAFFLTQRSYLTSLFNSVAATLPALLGASVSAHRIREFLGKPKELHDPEGLEKIKNVSDKGLSLEIRDLCFSYSDGRRVYEKAAFCARPGEVVGIVGGSGAGKTTLFRLLLGLLDPAEGSVVLRGADGCEVRMNSDIRRFISYVPQGNTMMMGTVADNMRIVKAEATDEELIEALKAACAWEFVRPLGLDHMIGERGKGLSEGQAQRLSIARALLRDAPVIMLDEATSALDRETEACVINNILDLYRERTVILSTHRESLLYRCVRVYCITDNQMVLSEE